MYISATNFSQFHIMIYNNYKKITLVLFFVLSIFVLQGVAQQKAEDPKPQTPPKKEEEEKPQNLKVLSKKMSQDDLHAIMRTYSKSLGVRCNHCHAQSKDDPKHLDFASDEKPTKATARKMIRMTADINKKYISKIDEGRLEQIACVTCHMGHLKPTISVDSLAKKVEN
jgi:hypothetical protein